MKDIARFLASPRYTTADLAVFVTIWLMGLASGVALGLVIVP